MKIKTKYAPPLRADHFHATEQGLKALEERNK